MYEVVRLDAAEVVPALVVAAAEQAGVVHTAAVVDGRQVVADGADVREVHVLLHDTPGGWWVGQASRRHHGAQ